MKSIVVWFCLSATLELILTKDNPIELHSLIYNIPKFAKNKFQTQIIKFRPESSLFSHIFQNVYVQSAEKAKNKHKGVQVKSVGSE